MKEFLAFLKEALIVVGGIILMTVILVGLYVYGMDQATR